MAVTVVESANSALSILSNGNEKFDVLMANFYQPDKKVNVKLLQEAVKMKLLVVRKYIILQFFFGVKYIDDILIN